MEVKVRVLMNAKEIADVQKANQIKEDQRVYDDNSGLEITSVLPNEDVPEKDIHLKEMLIDASLVDMITESSVDETYEVMYLGKGFQIVEDKEVWKKVESALKLRENKLLQ